MKLMISCDMEGISGVVAWNQVDPSHPDYQRFRHIMTADVNAAVAGASAAGADDIVITDGHWNSGNVLLEELDQRASLNTGTPTRFSMVQTAWMQPSSWGTMPTQVHLPRSLIIPGPACVLPTCGSTAA